MSVNTIPISARNQPYQGFATANGSYTLPQYAFIPHASLQQLAGPIVMEPTLGGDPTASFAATPYQQVVYPSPDFSGVYGIRSLQLKSSPI